MDDAITLRQLEYVVAVGEHGSFSRAAEAASVSQPTVSAQVQELEHRLGVVLFERGRSGARVTPEGAPVIAQARVVLAAVADLGRIAGDRAGDLVGPLGLAAIPTMGPYLLPLVVAEVRRRYPRAELLLREERTESLVESVRSGELDLGLLAGPVEGDDLTAVELADDPFLLAMPEDHPFVGGSALPASVLSGLPVVLLEDGHCLRDQALGVCATAGASALGEIQATSLASLSQMVAAGLGVTLLPASAVAVEARPGSGVAVRPFRRPAPSRRVVLVWRRRSPRADRFTTLAAALRAPVAARCRRRPG